MAAAQALELVVAGGPLRVLCRLATLRSIEKNPGVEVVRELFKAMLFAGGCEQEIAGNKLHALGATDKHAAASGHHVHLVARVRLLFVAAARGIDLNAE